MNDLNPLLGLGPMGLDFFTLEQVSERLSKLSGEQITPQTILDYGVQDTSGLIFCVYAHNWFLFRKTVDASGAISVTRDLLDGLVDLHPWTVKELRTKENVEVTWVKACAGARECAVTIHHWGHDPDSWKAVFNHHKEHDERMFPRISKTDLRIRRSELERLLVQVAPQIRADSVPQSSDDSFSCSFEQSTKSNVVDEKVASASSLGATSFEPDASVRASKEIDTPTQSITGELAKENAAQKLSRAETWKLRAKAIANELDPEHTTPKLNSLARDIQKKLNEEGLRNRNNELPSVETIEREILRGWKSKK